MRRTTDALAIIALIALVFRVSVVWASVGSGLEALATDPAKAASDCRAAADTAEQAGSAWVCVGMAQAAGARATPEQGAGPTLARVVARTLAASPPDSEESAALADSLVVDPREPASVASRHLGYGLTWIRARGSSPALHRLRARTLVLVVLLVEAKGHDDAVERWTSLHLVDVWLPHWGRGDLHPAAGRTAVEELDSLLFLRGAVTFEAATKAATSEGEGSTSARHASEWTALVHGPDRATTYRAALRLADAEGDPLCQLSLRELWAKVASSRDRLQQWSMLSFAAVPDLLWAAGTEPEVEPHWIRMALELGGADRRDEAFRLLGYLRGGRVWRWLHARGARETESGQVSWRRLLATSRQPLDLVGVRNGSGGGTFKATNRTHSYLAARAEVERAGGPAPPMPGLAEVQRALGALHPDATVLTYHPGDPGFWREILTPNRWEITYVEPRSIETAISLETMVYEVDRSFSSLARAPRGRALLSAQSAPWYALNKLHQLLLGRLADALPAGAPVFVVAPGAFGRVPFAALLATPPPASWTPESWRTARFFGAEHPVGTLPFASWLALPHRAPSEGSPLVFGKSDFSNAPPLREKGAPPLLPALPGVLEEVDTIAAMLPGSQRLCDDGCPGRPTLDAFESRAPTASVLHLATHADASVPGVYERASVLWLEDGRGRPARLWAQTIEAVPLTADLVVASACATGSAGGDDLEQDGFALPFLLGGARSVISTGWLVDDQSPIEMFSAFYPAWQAQTGPLRKLYALQAAQAALRAHGRVHPYYWAVFSLQGDPS